MLMIIARVAKIIAHRNREGGRKHIESPYSCFDWLGTAGERLARPVKGSPTISLQIYPCNFRRRQKSAWSFPLSKARILVKPDEKKRGYFERQSFTSQRKLHLQWSQLVAQPRFSEAPAFREKSLFLCPVVISARVAEVETQQNARHWKSHLV